MDAPQAHPRFLYIAFIVANILAQTAIGPHPLTPSPQTVRELQFVNPIAYNLQRNIRIYDIYVLH